LIKSGDNPQLQEIVMSSVESQSRIFEEIAELFASAPTTNQILEFRPSEQSKQRASELLQLNREGRLDGKLAGELDQYEQAELLMRLVKARIRSDQIQERDQS
jgi:hypothetical protein